MQVEFLNGYEVAMRLTIDVEQDRNAGTSTLKITKLEIKSKNGGRYPGRYVTGQIDLNGNPAAKCSISSMGGCPVNVTGEYSGGGDGIWNSAFWQSVALTVPHWATGACSVSLSANISVSTAMGDRLGAISETVTVDLPVIEPVAAAQIQVGAVELGKPATVTLTGTDDRAKYTVTWTCGTQSGTVATDQTAAQYSVTLPEALRAASKDGKTAAVTFRAVTKHGDKTVGQSTATVNAVVPMQETEYGEITAGDARTGEEWQINIVGAASTVKHTVQMIVGNRTETLATKTSSREIKYTPPDELAAQFPTANKTEATVRAIAYIGDQEVARKTKKIWLWAGDGTNPSIGEITLADVSSLHAPVSRLIRGQSQLRVAAQITPKYGATIKNADITIEIQGSTKLSKAGTEATFVPDRWGTVELTVSATDSRGAGVLARQMNAAYVTEYTRPTVRISSAYRCNASGKADDQGNYAKIIFSATASSTTVLPIEAQSIRYKAAAKEYGAASWTETEISAYAGVLSVQNGQVIVPLGTEGAYVVQIKAEDKYDSGASMWATIPGKYALMDFDRDRKAVGIGAKAEKANTLSVGMTTDLSGHKVQNVLDPTEEQDAATKKYVDEAMLDHVDLKPTGGGVLLGTGYGLNATTIRFLIPIPGTMRKKPTITLQEGATLRIFGLHNGNYGYVEVDSLTVTNAAPGAVTVQANVSGATPFSAYNLANVSGVSVVIQC